MDIFIASKLVEERVDRIKEIRSAKDTEFESCFEDAKQIADDEYSDSNPKSLF